MQKAARALSVLGGLAIALAEDADVDGSFEDGSGSGEPGSGEPSSGVYPSPPPPVATPMILLAICVFCVLKSCGKKEVGGSLASGAARVRPGGPRPQAGPMTDQGQELVVKTSSPAAGI